MVFQFNLSKVYQKKFAKKKKKKKKQKKKDFSTVWVNSRI